MIGPKRLIEEGSELDRRLLHASRADRPSTGFEDRVIAAAGLGSAARGAAQKPWFASWIPFVLLIGVGMGAVAALSLSHASGAAASASTERAPSSGAVAPRPSAAPLAIPAATERNGEPLAEGTVGVRVEDLSDGPLTADRPVKTKREAPPVREGAAQAPAASSAAAAPAHPIVAPSGPNAEPGAQAQTGASLQREIELLDAVKRHLRSGATPAAERALVVYDSEFPSGTLKPEAGLLRVRVLLAKGDRNGARELGDELLRKQPNAVLERRIRAALASADEKSSSAQGSPR